MSAAAIWSHAGTGVMLTASQGRADDVRLVHGLDVAKPLIVSPAIREAGPVIQTVAQAGNTVTVSREP